MTNVPVACTLSHEQLRCASDALLPGLAEQADRVERLPDAARLTFRSRPGIIGRIASTIEAERECCRFLRFTVDAPGDGGDVVVLVTGPAGTGAFLASLHPAFGIEG